MAIFNPAYTIIVPFLFIFTLPIALFASLTTVVAFSILFLRVLLVYCELAVAVIPYYVLGMGHPSQSQSHAQAAAAAAAAAATAAKKTLTYTYPRATTPPAATRRRKRRSNSSSSNLSIASASSVIFMPTNLSDTALHLPLPASIGPARDFEGVGGWRLDNRSDDEDALWTGMNSRLELPADHVRRHHRSHTGEGFISQKGFAGGSGNGSGGGRGYSPENVMNTGRSRARTPTGVATALGMEGYFSHPMSPSAGKMVRTGRTASGSSGSSKGSSERMLSMKQR